MPEVDLGERRHGGRGLVVATDVDQHLERVLQVAERVVGLAEQVVEPAEVVEQPADVGLVLDFLVERPRALGVVARRTQWPSRSAISEAWK